MAEQQYITIRNVMDKVTRHPLMQGISLETMVDYTIDFMRIVGNPTIFEEKTVVLPIKKYRASLPCDYYQMTQVRDDKGRTLRYTTDSFHLSDNKSYNNLTYKVQGGIIYTGFENGEIEISYDAIATDDEGYPYLPDNSSFTRALELYIKKQWFTILFDMGKINPNILQQVNQDYAWAVGDCQNEFNRLSIDKAESLYNSWRTMILKDSEHSRGFKTNGDKQKLRNI